MVKYKLSIYLINFFFVLIGNIKIMTEKVTGVHGQILINANNNICNRVQKWNVRNHTLKILAYHFPDYIIDIAVVNVHTNFTQWYVS